MYKRVLELARAVLANDKGGTVNVIGYGLCVIGAALGIGLASSAVANSMARQPEVQGRLFTVFILASAFIEALCLIGFVVAIM
jgi:F-type H+-transporting ATPase subunit c